MTLLTINGNVVNESADFDDPYNPVQTVISRFDTTLAKAEEVYTLLFGASGDTGLLGDMQAALASAPTTSVTAPVVDTTVTLTSSGATLPVFDANALQAFPTDTYAEPIMAGLPTVSTDFSGIVAPDDLAFSMAWAEGALPAVLYSALQTRLLNDLQSGATGLDPIVEAAIYERARLRQQADRLAEWNRINDTAAALQFAMPSGVLASALTDFGIGATRQDADIENNIITTQADLAQKNSQFSIQQSVALEQLIRQSHTDTSGRALDYAKSLASEARELFATKIQKYIADWQGRKTQVEAEVEALRGVIESNKGLIEIFKAQYDALKTRVDAVASFNKGVTDVYLGQVQGYGEGERAISSLNDSKIKYLAEQIKDADMDLRASIAQAEATISGYASEMSVKEKFSNDIAQIAGQVIASMLSAVHAGASLGYSGSESSTKNFSIGASLHENHSYEHDPTA